ncbi:MAG TPA: hypothetical protein VJV78_44055, partial [Polyangiales bacterium]|nr:hypothetical protein [Polyangiales bacterium]
AAYLLASSRRAPLLVVLDDLHAADTSSLQLAQFVSRSLRGARLCLLGSHRDFEARRAPEIDAALSRLARAGERYPLARLAVDEVACLVRAETGREDQQAARMIHDATEGNPLFVRELLRLIAARGAAGGGGVPAGVRAVIRERLSLLTPASVALLQAAAVCGREFSLRLAAEVAGVTSAALDEAAAEAQSAELLAEQRPGRWRFSHALVAETLAADLPAAVRTRLHRRAADALERWRADDPGAVSLDEIAYHFLNAGSDAAEQAVAAATRAADAAAMRLAFADAAAGYERALGALGADAPDSARRRAELLIAQSEAFVRAGERSRAESACNAAANIAAALDDGTLLARAALALGADVTAGYVDATLVRLLERALCQLAPGDGAWRARVMARLASARQPENDPEQPMQLAREAIAMARRLGDPQVLLHTLHSALGALTDFAPPAERAALNREAVALAAAANDRVRELRARTRWMFDCAQLGDVLEFEIALAGYEALLRDVDQPRYGWVPLMFRSMRANWQGDFAEGDRLEREARAMHERAAGDGPPLLPARGFGNAILRADDAALERCGRELHVTYAADLAFGVLFEAFVEARRGGGQQAREMIASGMARFPDVLGDVHVVELVSDVVWRLRDAALAERILPRLERYRGQLLTMSGIAYTVHGAVDHVLMQICSVLRRDAEADRYALAALDLCARIGSRPIAARVRYDWAIALRERGDTAALERAEPLLRQALATAEALPMPHLAERCRAALQTSVAVAPSPQPPAAGVQLVLEGEYWTVRGYGEFCRVRDNRGMRMLAQLIAAPGRELHVLDLSGGQGAVDGGDAGALLDPTARSAYENRLRELQAELDEADAANDAGRRERLQGEYEQLCAELSRAFGLGSRERRAGSAVERARVNVRRRLSLALEHIAKTCPELGRQLDHDLQTGVYCAYRPGSSGSGG